MENEFDLLEDYIRQEMEEKNKFKKALSFYKDNCIVPFDKISDLDIMDFEGGDFYHVGYCNVKKTDINKPYAPSNEYFSIQNSDTGENDEIIYKLHFVKQDENEYFHTLVWQTTISCEDDYTGYILFPMKDGKYWIVRFDNI